MSTERINIDPLVVTIAMQIQVEYKRALKLPCKKPLAYALHEVWKLWDEFEPTLGKGGDEE